MKALVTGAAGFIGSTLSKQLLSEGHNVLGIDNFSDYYSSELKFANIANLDSDSFELIRADLNDINLDEYVKDVDYIFHLAGQPGVRSSWGTSFGTYIAHNVMATQKLLEASMKSANLKKFIYASSSSVYGEASRYPCSETDITNPLSPYGVTKLAGENLCTLFGRNFGLPTVSLRYFTVYGPGQRPDMAFTRFLRAGLRDEEIHIYGSGQQIRDFTFISDVVRANLLAAESACIPGSVFNVAGGTNVSVSEVLDIVEQLLGHPLKVHKTKSIPGDVSQTGGSIEKISSDLGWKPEVQLVQGLDAQRLWVINSLNQGHEIKD